MLRSSMFQMRGGRAISTLAEASPNRSSRADFMHRSGLRSVVLAVIAAFIPMGAAIAECSNELCQDVTVTVVYPNAWDKTVWIETSGTETQLSCSAQGGIYLKLDGNDPGAQQVYALILTAFASKLRINFVMVPGAAPCRISHIASMRD
jgi:hypothetical protein